MIGHKAGSLYARVTARSTAAFIQYNRWGKLWFSGMEVKWRSAMGYPEQGIFSALWMAAQSYLEYGMWFGVVRVQCNMGLIQLSLQAVEINPLTSMRIRLSPLWDSISYYNRKFTYISIVFITGNRNERGGIMHRWCKICRDHLFKG